MTHDFLKQAPFPRRVLQGKCRCFKSGGSLGMVQVFAGKLPTVHCPPQCGQINFLKHKCGHKMNKVMAFDEKAPDYIENMLQLYIE